MDAASVFEIQPALDREIAQAAGLLADARSVVALTGAGLSVESGIPPFRGPGGLWTRYGEPPMDGYGRFLADPAAAWRERLNPTARWAKSLQETLSRARPGAGHRALARLEQLGLLSALITQNIDDLHGQAGSKALIEIHGNHRLLRCIDCHQRFEAEAVPVDPDDLPPRCIECGGIVKGDTVQFGEPIPPAVLKRCFEVVEACDCMLVVGTSATVFPAAEFPMEVLRRGGAIVEVNAYESDLTPAATISLRGPGGAVLERLVDHARDLQAGGARP